MVMKQTESSILLYNGEFFDFRKPFDHKFDIETIAYSLSNLCRYTGHSKKFYSVAEHSVLVSQIVEEPYALEGLMHDTSEAFCGDVSSPLKKLVPEFKKIENNIQRAIFNYYGLRYPIPDCVHVADKIAYVTERQTVSHTGEDKIWYVDYEPSSIPAIGYRPQDAYELFMDRFKELNNARNAVLLSEAATGAEAA